MVGTGFDGIVFGPSRLMRSDPIPLDWNSLDSTRGDWSPLDSIRIDWSPLDGSAIDSHWTETDPIEFDWINLIGLSPIELDSIGLSPIGLNWIRLSPIGLDSPKFTLQIFLLDLKAFTSNFQFRKWVCPGIRSNIRGPTPI